MAAFFLLIVVAAFFIDRGRKRAREDRRLRDELERYRLGLAPLPQPMQASPLPRGRDFVLIGKLWAWACSPEKVGWMVVRVCVLYLAVVFGLAIIFFLMQFAPVR